MSSRDFLEQGLEEINRSTTETLRYFREVVESIPDNANANQDKYFDFIVKEAIRWIGGAFNYYRISNEESEELSAAMRKETGSETIDTKKHLLLELEKVGELLEEHYKKEKERARETNEGEVGKLMGSLGGLMNSMFGIAPQLPPLDKTNAASAIGELENIKSEIDSYEQEEDWDKFRNSVANRVMEIMEFMKEDARFSELMRKESWDTIDKVPPDKLKIVVNTALEIAEKKAESLPA